MASFDHLIGLRVDGWRDGQAERAGGLAVDHQLRGELFDREIGRPRALEDSINERGGATIGFLDAFAVAHEAANFDIIALRVNARQAVLEREVGYSLRLAQEI